MDLRGDETGADKTALRQAMRDRRLALSTDEAAAKSTTATQHLVTLPAVVRASMIAIYVSMPGEIDTAPAIHALRLAGKRLAFPRVVKATRVLDFHELHEHSTLVTSRFGVSEPDGDAPLVSLDQIDLFVVPGLAFDLRGDRLGWGRAHYDNTLAAAPSALRVGFAFELQIVPAVPTGPGDERVDVLVTESGARVVGERPVRRPP